MIYRVNAIYIKIPAGVCVCVCAVSVYAHMHAHICVETKMLQNNSKMHTEMQST